MDRRGDLATMLASEMLLLGGIAAYIEGHQAIAGACVGALVGGLVLHFSVARRASARAYAKALA